MGLIKLNKYHRNQARRETWGDPLLRQGKKISPDDLFEHASNELERRGIRIVERRKKNVKIISLANKLKVPKGWDDKDKVFKASDLMHELVHYRQRSTFGKHWWEFRYVASAQFVIAMEVPAYFESLASYYAMGASEEFIESYIRDIPGFLRSYLTSGALHWNSTKKFILKETRNRYRELRALG
jgi:hypothetical protein